MNIKIISRYLVVWKPIKQKKKRKRERRRERREEEKKGREEEGRGEEKKKEEEMKNADSSLTLPNILGGPVMPSKMQLKAHFV